MTTAHHPQPQAQVLPSRNGSSVDAAEGNETADDALVRPGEEWNSELHRIGATQFDRAADVLNLDQESRERLRNPRRALTVNFPVRMDDGTVRSFTGYRVQHTLTMGRRKEEYATRPRSRRANVQRWPRG